MIMIQVVICILWLYVSINIALQSIISIFLFQPIHAIIWLYMKTVFVSNVPVLDVYFPVSLSWRKCDILHFHAVWQTDTNTSYITVGATSNLSGLLRYIRGLTLCYCWLKQWHTAYPVLRQNLNQYGLIIIHFCKLNYDDSLRCRRVLYIKITLLSNTDTEYIPINV